MSERDTQHQIVDMLRAAGWYVRVLSASRGMPAQLAGLPDVIAFKSGVTLLVECKSARGKLRDQQRAFAGAIQPHLATTLRYVVARSIDDILPALMV